MNTPKVTLDQWRALQAVIDYGSYARAAEKLNRSQSSVSYAVNRLQQLIGTQLLHIEGRKAVLSDSGKILLQRSRQLLADAYSIEQQAHLLEQGWEPEIRLAVEAAFPTQLLMDALRQFKPQARDTRIRLQEVVLSGAEDILLTDGADLVISSYVPKGYLGDEIIRVNFIAVAHPEHPLHQLNRELNTDDLNRETHVVITDSGQKGIDSGWLSESRRWAVTSKESARKIICSGLGYGWLPEAEIEQHVIKNELKPLKLNHGLQHTGILYLVHANNQAGPAIRLLADILKQVSS